jgi:SAM-dependent methyltransferase
MSHKTVRDFIDINLSVGEVENRDVLEVGSRDINGEVRGVIGKKSPKSFMGVDMIAGPGVDRVCNIYDLVNTFGLGTFDLVVTTETFEHVKDWRNGVRNIKGVLREGGTLLLTTRSFGMDYHGYPNDFWRYQKEDMKDIFGDFETIKLEDDPTLPGVFLKCKKPSSWKENDLSEVRLFSVLTKCRIKEIRPHHYAYFILNSIYRRLIRMFGGKTGKGR